MLKEIITNIDSNYKEALRNIYCSDSEKVLTKNNIIDIHNYAVFKYGGGLGIRDEKLLESVIVSPYQEVFGEKLYPSVFDKSAKLLYDFADYQIFIDGNKRTGVYCCLALLEINNIKLSLDNKRLFDVAMDIANNKVSLKEVSKILKDNAYKVELSGNIEKNNDCLKSESKENDNYDRE